MSNTNKIYSIDDILKKPIKKSSKQNLDVEENIDDDDDSKDIGDDDEASAHLNQDDESVHTEPESDSEIKDSQCFNHKGNRNAFNQMSDGTLFNTSPSSPVSNMQSLNPPSINTSLFGNLLPPHFIPFTTPLSLRESLIRSHQEHESYLHNMRAACRKITFDEHEKCDKTSIQNENFDENSEKDVLIHENEQKHDDEFGCKKCLELSPNHSDGTREDVMKEKIPCVSRSFPAIGSAFPSPLCFPMFVDNPGHMSKALLGSGCEPPWMSATQLLMSRMSSDVIMQRHLLSVNAASFQRRSRKARLERKPRQAYSSKQLDRLESEFKNDKYLNVNKRTELSQTLGLTETQIKTWFQNRRTKWKKQITAKMKLTQRSQGDSGMWGTSTSKSLFWSADFPSQLPITFSNSSSSTAVD